MTRSLAGRMTDWACAVVGASASGAKAQAAVSIDWIRRRFMVVPLEVAKFAVVTNVAIYLLPTTTISVALPRVTRTAGPEGMRTVLPACAGALGAACGAEARRGAERRWKRETSAPVTKVVAP